MGMSKFQTCIFRKSAGGGVRRPVWFDAERKKRVFVEAVRTGQAVHACKHLKKEYRTPEGCLPGQVAQT